MVKIERILCNYGVAALAGAPIVVRMGAVQRFFVVLVDTGVKHDWATRDMALPLL